MPEAPKDAGHDSTPARGYLNVQNLDDLPPEERRKIIARILEELNQMRQKAPHQPDADPNAQPPE